MYVTDDPIADFNRWDDEQQRRLEKLPQCSHCGEYIQEDHYYLINDEIFCSDCLDNEFRKEVEDYAE